MATSHIWAKACFSTALELRIFFTFLQERNKEGEEKYPTHNICRSQSLKYLLSHSLRKRFSDHIKESNKGKGLLYSTQKA